MKKLWDDPTVVPEGGDDPAAALARAVAVDDPQCAAYLTRRGVPVEVARAAGVRFAPSFDRRAAVLAPMRRRDGELAAVTARYLTTIRGQEKILTVGHEGGVFTVLDGLAADPLLLVEGVFDALSLAACGVPCVATIGRYVGWLEDVGVGRTVLLGFDGNKVGDHAARYYKDRMTGADCHRLRPPLVLQGLERRARQAGRHGTTRWLAAAMPQRTTAGLGPDPMHDLIRFGEITLDTIGSAAVAPAAGSASILDALAPATAAAPPTSPPTSRCAGPAPRHWSAPRGRTSCAAATAT